MDNSILSKANDLKCSIDYMAFFERNIKYAKVQFYSNYTKTESDKMNIPKLVEKEINDSFIKWEKFITNIVSLKLKELNEEFNNLK